MTKRGTRGVGLVTKVDGLSRSGWLRESGTMSPFIISPGVELEGLRMTSHQNAIRCEMPRDHLCLVFLLL